MITFVVWLTAFIAALALAALIWQIATRRSVRVSVVGAVAGACAAMFFGLIKPDTDLAQLTGISDAGRLAGHISILISGYAAQMIFVGMVKDPEVRKRRHRVLLGILIVGVVALTACMLADPHAIFEARFAQQPAVFAYLVVFLSYLGMCVVGIALNAHRRARELAAIARESKTPKASQSFRYLQVGLRVLSLLGPVGGLYILVKISFLIATITGVAMPFGEHAPGGALSSLSVLIAVAGVTIPLLGPPIDNAGRTIWAWNTNRRLEQLWSLVAERRNLDLPSGWSGLKEAKLCLHMRIAEIHDGLWTLQRWMPAGQIPDEPRQAATAIDQALAARTRGEASSADLGTSTDRPSNTRTEASWLLQVAAHTRTAQKAAQ